LKLSSRKRLSLLLFAAVSASWAGGQGPIPSPAPPYDAYLWIDQDFTLDEAGIARLRSLGITGIDAEGPDGVARAGRTGLPFYVDHSIPKGLLHLRRAAFDEARERWRADPSPANLRRPVCLRDPQALARASADLKKTLDACAPFSPAFVSLTDEPSATKGINPIDWCRDSFCTAAFPAFLARRWGSAATAREVWGERWPKDGDPAPVETEEARRSLLHGIGSPSTLVRWNDTRAFAEAAFLDALGSLGAEARKLRPGLKLALLGASMPSAFGGFDWEELGPMFDVIEPYDWGAARDLARSTSPRAEIFQTITPRPGALAAIRHQLWRGFLRGDRGVILFDASSWSGASESRPETRPSLPDLAPLLKRLAGDDLAAWRRATPFRAQVAILHSMPSTRLHWLLDTRYDGATWFNRLTSYEEEESSEALNREAWASLLSDLGFTYRFVTPRDLRDGALEAEGTLALVLPRAIALSDPEVAAVSKFAAGHLVVADCQLALYTARLQARAKPALDALFGISRPKVRGVDDLVAREPASRPGAAPVPAEPGIAAVDAAPVQLVGQVPLFLVHGHRTARTVYLNLRLGSYVRTRLTHPDAAERLRAPLRPLFLAGGVRPRFEVAQTGSRWPIAIHARKDGDDFLVAIELAATTGARAIDWNGPVASARPRVQVTLPGTYHVRDVLRGEDLGPRNSVEAEVSVTEPALLRLRP
jgi:hypothetical protein